MNIRPLKISDLEQVELIEKAVFKQTLGIEFLYQEITLNPSAYYLVIEYHDMVIGYIGYRLHEHMAEMMNFVIHQSYQNQGFGKKLLKESILSLMEKHIKLITLEVRKSNQKARRFYESFGFAISHIKKNYYDAEDAYVYVKEVQS